MNFTRRTACMACVLATAVVAAPAHAQSPAPEGVLGISASATVEVPKDVIVVTFSTTREASEASVVQTELKQALDVALAEAKKIARPGDVDVQTGNFSIFPRYASNGSSARDAITAWQGSADLVVEGRDMAAIGQLTGRIATLTIASVGYRLSREASRRVEADVVAEAIAAFRDKAASYARQFGFAGYSVREVSVATDQPQLPQPRLRMQASAMSSAVALPVEPGNASVTATVSGTVQMQR